MSKFDDVLSRILDEEETSLFGENLILKKRSLPNDEYSFVVTSDNPDVAKGNNETFIKRELIKGSGLFYFDRTNTRKWVSTEKYNLEDFEKQIPIFQKALNDINKLDYIITKAEEIEEYGDVGFSERISNFINELKSKVSEAAQSKEVKDFMDFKKKFRKYSLYNTILIFMQKPDATHIKGRKQWETEFGRRLKAGEKGIYIYIPISKKKDKEELEDTDPQPQTSNDLRNYAKFKLVPVFDISQTEPIEGKAKEIPETPKWYSDENTNEKTKVIFDALLDLAKSKNIKVEIGNVGHPGARGVSMGGSIALLQENISTMIHEIAHELMHSKEDRASLSSLVKELQAEGVANVVLREFDLPAEHTHKYMALWKIDPEHITQHESAIKDTASIIIDHINEFATRETKSEIPESISKFDNLYRKFLS